MCVCVHMHEHTVLKNALQLCGSLRPVVLSFLNLTTEVITFYTKIFILPELIVLFVSRSHEFNVSYINLAVISLRSIILKIYKVF